MSKLQATTIAMGSSQEALLQVRLDSKTKEPLMAKEERYPVDWVVNGGPTYENCPDAPDFEEEQVPFEIAHIERDGSMEWYIHHQGKVLLKTDNPSDISDYITQYAYGIARYMKEFR